MGVRIQDGSLLGQGMKKVWSGEGERGVRKEDDMRNFE
jgi:hypothetical protein